MVNLDVQAEEESDMTDRRQALLQAELSRCLDLLTRHYAPHCIYLFGSMAGGALSPWSDLDLVMVVDTDERFLERTRQVMELLRPRVGVDVLVYTPAEFEQMRARGMFVNTEVIDKGLLLYERE